jgi:hypothetical protein
MKYPGNKFGRKRFSMIPKEQGQAKHEGTRKKFSFKDCPQISQRKELCHEGGE